MPLSWNEIKSRALKFSKEWAEETSERAEAKSFWDAFFNVYGVPRRRIASFEQHVKRIDGHDGYIDLLWKGVLLVEHKSSGKDLDRAHSQAVDYFPGLKDRELPRYIVVCNFQKFRLYDLESGTQNEFNIEELHANVGLFGFLAGYQTHKLEEQDPANVRAAERMGLLHDKMKEVGYEGRDLEVYLVRLLFCMFAEDTGIFDRQQFQTYIEERTSEDGSDLAGHLATLFQILNTEEEKRLSNRDEQLAGFAYINGKLFEQALPIASFDAEMRNILLESCGLDWSYISPAIFGSLFQSIMDAEARHDLGAHYTSEKNILKLINPLFMDELRFEFEKVKNNRRKLVQFHDKLRSLVFLDPACGCGNFLVVAYREMRLLELDVLRSANKGGQLSFDIHKMIQVDVDQFYGIEIEEFPAQIAQVALWLIDHQMNLLVSKEFGKYFSRIPLTSSPHIVCGNALDLEWSSVVPALNLNYIIGNPPFLGKKEQSPQQKTEVKTIFSGLNGCTKLDYVACWFKKSVDQLLENSDIKIALVSTNSITQGEQVGILWRHLYDQGVHINFAHRTFRWSNEARGVAAVHCVIIGMASEAAKNKILFDYVDINGEPVARKVKKINSYLVEAENHLLKTRRSHISKEIKLSFGNMPNDGGYLLMSEDEKNELIGVEPGASQFIKLYQGSEEFINRIPRWCIWLKDVPPNQFRGMRHVMERVEGVRKQRQKSTRQETNDLSKTPFLFGEIRQPQSQYIAIPKTSSETREYVPIGYLSPEVIASTELFTIDEGDNYTFGILTSLMHMSWVRAVCGRLKSDYRYSAGIVYNNFPWPSNVSDARKRDIASKVDRLLEARAQFPESSLADLYDPLAMPADVLNAHHAIDKSVDAAYGKRSFKAEVDRVVYLFEAYGRLTQ